MSVSTAHGPEKTGITNCLNQVQEHLNYFGKKLVKDETVNIVTALGIAMITSLPTNYWTGLLAGAAVYSTVAYYRVTARAAEIEEKAQGCFEVYENKNLPEIVKSQQQELAQLQIKSETQEQKLTQLQTKSETQEQELAQLHTEREAQEQKLTQLQTKSEAQGQKLTQLQTKSETQEQELAKLHIKCETQLRGHYLLHGIIKEERKIGKHMRDKILTLDVTINTLKAENQQLKEQFISVADSTPFDEQ